MANQTPQAGSQPAKVKLPAVRGPESKKRGGTQQSWRSSY
jgi:hypothetical protein